MSIFTDLLTQRFGTNLTTILKDYNSSGHLQLRITHEHDTPPVVKVIYDKISNVLIQIIAFNENNDSVSKQLDNEGALRSQLECELSAIVMDSPIFLLDLGLRPEDIANVFIDNMLDPLVENTLGIRNMRNNKFD